MDSFEEDGASGRAPEINLSYLIKITASAQEKDLATLQLTVEETEEKSIHLIMGNNIQTPFSSYVNGGIRDGMSVTINGRLGHGDGSFSINLCSAYSKDAGDVALHFNPRLNQGNVVRNHKQGGGWGAEETAGGFPFRKDRNFVFTVTAKSHGFYIEVDGRHFCDFTHRMSMGAVQYLTIEGDVRINNINFKHPLPYSAPVPGGLRNGSVITINGKVENHFNNFAVNLSSAPGKHGDIALHFNPRHNDGNVVRNHLQGSWGAEETAGGMPFRRGQSFQIQIRVDGSGYRVFVNGGHFCDFTHRMSERSVQYVFIEGDIELYSVDM
ncbi:hypothetical protein RRG08_012686 [Elysia crispata]|uniref:Galectin n=1 Tax=Elysia crispata TaxID=231223 RepID=A0AAE0YNL3_9GAST|nr:hypothetical protein RRG08_012686 [Elysia crispata]